MACARLLDALRAERANVIHSGRIHKEDRPDGKQFHRLLHRIGGCARDLRHDGNLLLSNGIQQA